MDKLGNSITFTLNCYIFVWACRRYNGLGLVMIRHILGLFDHLFYLCHHSLTCICIAFVFTLPFLYILVVNINISHYISFQYILVYWLPILDWMQFWEEVLEHSHMEMPKKLHLISSKTTLFILHYHLTIHPRFHALFSYHYI